MQRFRRQWLALWLVFWGGGLSAVRLDCGHEVLSHPGGIKIPAYLLARESYRIKIQRQGLRGTGIFAAGTGVIVYASNDQVKVFNRHGIMNAPLDDFYVSGNIRAVRLTESDDLIIALPRSIVVFQLVNGKYTPIQTISLNQDLPPGENVFNLTVMESYDDEGDREILMAVACSTGYIKAGGMSSSALIYSLRPKRTTGNRAWLINEFYEANKVRDQIAISEGEDGGPRYLLFAGDGSMKVFEIGRDTSYKNVVTLPPMQPFAERNLTGRLWSANMRRAKFADGVRRNIILLGRERSVESYFVSPAIGITTGTQISVARALSTQSIGFRRPSAGSQLAIFVGGIDGSRSSNRSYATYGVDVSDPAKMIPDPNTPIWEF